MASVETETKKVEEEEKSGELLVCGATAWDMIGKKTGLSESNLVSPTRLRPLVGVNIRYVSSGCSSCHCLALDVEGRCYTWGRNEKGQLGHGDQVQRDRPTIVSGLSKYNIIKAATGRSHTVMISDDGVSLSFGWNKHGQLGTGTIKNELELSPVRCLVSEVTHVACGADFTVWLASVEGSSILTAGHPQFGQLGHGTDNEYNSKDSSVKLVYEPQPKPKAIASLADETVVKVACGTNHTVAVDSKGYVYTWGYGGYGRLGHREQKDEWAPRRVDVFQRHNVLPPNAIVSAGSSNSACTSAGGQLFMWGKMKANGDDCMYPKPLLDLSGWNIRCMDSGYMHHFVGADNSCISWGQAIHGELGYGPTGQKSSANPKKVDILDNMHVIGVACGYGHSMVIVDRTNVGDRLDQLDIYDGKAADEEGNKEPEAKKVPKKAATNSSENSNKRKKTNDSSDSEDEEHDESEKDSEEDSEEEHGNGHSKSKKTRGGKVSGRGRGRGANKDTTPEVKRGRGRPPSAKKTTPQAEVNELPKGKRGRPRKN